MDYLLAIYLFVSFLISAYVVYATFFQEITPEMKAGMLQDGAAVLCLVVVRRCLISFLWPLDALVAVLAFINQKSSK